MKRIEKIVTQIDIPFPETCGKCPLLYEDGDYLTCCATKMSGGYKFNPDIEKLSFCPLSKWIQIIRVPDENEDIYIK